MNTLLLTLKYFVTITVELVVLFLVISAAIQFVQFYINPDKIRKALSGKGVLGNIIAAAFGALTPFCACSTIPMTVGFLNAGVRFGSTMSFLIASPLLNPIIIGMLAATVGLKAAILYFILAFISSVIFGILIEKSGGDRNIRALRSKLNISGNCCGEEEKSNLSFVDKLKISFKEAWKGLKPIMLYLLIGVALGAAIYGYMPSEFVLKVAGPENMFAVPVAAVIGIPLYIRAETAIPIGVALMGKGMSVGTVIALIIGGAGMAIPEMSMLAGIFKTRLVAMLVAVIFFTAVISGYLFNLFY